MAPERKLPYDCAIKSRDVREVGMGIQVLAIAAAAIAIIWIIVLWGSRYFGPR